MIANYGYMDGSGEYFISIDTERCDGCGECVFKCPQGIFETVEDENDPFREEPVAQIREEHRKKLKYLCASCKPTKRLKELPCIKACNPKAIKHSW
ncbi:MAG: 4Fe-4S binding protein [Candidatus Methanofastidiosia archaeon]